MTDVPPIDPNLAAVLREGGTLAEEAARSFLGRVSGAPIAELSGLMGDWIRSKRWEHQVRALLKAERILREAQIDPNRVSLKLLVPMLEGASVEDDESMQDRWAALLANAANSRVHSSLHQKSASYSEGAFSHRCVSPGLYLRTFR